MTTTFAIVMVFAEVWLLVHGWVVAAAGLALLIRPLAPFALRRERRG